MGRKRIGLLIIFLLICSLAYAKSKYTFNPYTSKLDNLGDANDILTCETSDDFCFVYGDSVLKLYVNNTLQAQWPITAEEYHLLLDDGLGGYKLLLDDGVGGYFLIIK